MTMDTAVQVVALSGSGQQHGSVYWRDDAEPVLRGLRRDTALLPQLAGCFAVPESPIWMDSSTTAECETLQRCVGGAAELARITGSRCAHDCGHRAVC
jgi:xylulokinase